MSVEADVVLVSIGRVPYTEGLRLEAAGVKVGKTPSETAALMREVLAAG